MPSTINLARSRTTSMDSFASLFPFAYEDTDDIDELFFQFSNSDQPLQYSADRQAINSNKLENTIIDIPQHKAARYSQQKARAASSVSISPTEHENEKKMLHRENERHRRQEMAHLYRSLRSHIPYEYFKGKRSVSDHVHETVKYVTDLQERVKLLDSKRDRLKLQTMENASKLCNFSDASKRPFLLESSQSQNMTNVVVKRSRGGFEVSASTSLRGGLPLSILLRALIQQGLSISSCSSIAVQDKLLHTVDSEMKKANSIDVDELQQRLMDLLGISAIFAIN